MAYQAKSVIENHQRMAYQRHGRRRKSSKEMAAGMEDRHARVDGSAVINDHGVNRRSRRLAHAVSRGSSSLSAAAQARKHSVTFMADAVKAARALAALARQK